MKHSFSGRSFRTLFPALALCAMAAFAVLFAGGARADNAVTLESLRTAIAQAETELAEAKAELAEARYAAEAASGYRPFTAVGVHCLLDGRYAVELESGADPVRCVPVLPAGMEFDHWEINGEPADGGAEGASFTLTETSVVTAVLRESRVVTGRYADLQFLDARGRTAGGTFETFDFREAYVHPVTAKSCEAGLITLRVTAAPPRGRKLTGWYFNGVLHTFKKETSAFTVELLDHTMVYEAAMR